MCPRCGRGVMLGVGTKKFKDNDGFEYTLPSNVLLRCSNCRAYSIDIDARDSLLETTRIGLKDYYRSRGMDNLAISLAVLSAVEAYQTFLRSVEGSSMDIL